MSFMAIMNKAATTKSVEATNTNQTSTTKPLPSFLKQKAPVKAEEVKEEVVVETSTKETNVVEENAAQEVQKTNIETTEEVKENQKQTVKEVTSQETETVVEKETVEETSVETAETTTASEETTKKRGRRKKTKTAPTVVSKEVLREIEEDIELDQALEITSCKIVDSKWEEFKQQIAEELNQIELSSDMNISKAKALIAKLDHLYQLIWFDYQAAKNKYEQLSAKEPEGLIRRVKRLNVGEGSNAETRERAGMIACMNYRKDDSNEAIDLYQLLDIVKERFDFLDAVMKSIEFKRNLLINFNGLLKLESDLTK